MTAAMLGYAALGGAAFAVLWNVCGFAFKRRTTCPHCRATESVRLTPDLRRCGRCYGRYPEPG